MTDFEEAIQAAYDIIDWRQSASRLKEVIHESLVKMDPSVKVRHTNFFNHSYEPDLYAHWPGTINVRERPVFLRTVNDVDFLSSDIKRLEDMAPVIVTLSEARQEDTPEHTSGPTSMAPARTLIASPSYLNTMETRATDSIGANLYASSALKAGRGDFDGSDATTHLAAATRGFAGALRGNAEATESALDVFEDTLSSSEAHAVKGIYQAVWMGSGAHAYDFPRHDESVIQGLTPNALRVLLNLDFSGDIEYWDRVAHGVDMNLLAGLENQSATPQFQHLMQRAANRVRAKMAAVRTFGDTDADTRVDGWTWSVSNRALHLENGIHDITLGMSRDALGQLHEQQGPSVASFVSRADSLPKPVTEVEIVQENATVRWSSQGGNDLFPERGDASELLVGQGASLVKKMAVLSSQGARLEFNFERLTASGRTAATFPLPELATKSLVVFVDDTAANDPSFQAAFEVSPTTPQFSDRTEDDPEELVEPSSIVD